MEITNNITTYPEQKVMRTVGVNLKWCNGYSLRLCGFRRCPSTGY